jgi:hypothetical protein
MAALAPPAPAPRIASALVDSVLLLAIVACIPIAILVVGAPLAILLSLVLRAIALF